ncbi:DUF159 family protein [Halobacteriales archaeon QS_4_69_34]|nr:MAG: DUF159 family protein [Halobacteriales archaeon QS_4_69_34]
MCGRYSLFTSPEELEARFDASFEHPFEPRYNAAPSQELPVIRDASPETIEELRWGLVPSWADDPAIGDRLINARAETVGRRRSFRDAYESRRCLVLADGFYEWTDTGQGTQPYRVALESGEPFAMAGLWETWQPPQRQTGLADFGSGEPDREADPVETFTIVTTEPNETVEPLHDRMAVVLPPENEDRWLDGEASGEVLAPHPGEMRASPVSTAVNDPANDSPALVEEVEPAD